MISITHQRKKCIGCNYCVEIAPDQWAMSKKDGKSVLIGAIEKKGFFRIQIAEAALEKNKQAANACPVNIIKIN
ncbi:MAG: ferredoxin [Ferruginibacter sp.]